MDENKIIAMILETAEDGTANTFANLATVVSEGIYILQENSGFTRRDADLARKNVIRNQNFYEIIIPAYSLDDFYIHFRMTRIQFEKLSCEIAAVDKIFHRIELQKQLLFTIWMLAHSSSFSENADRFNISKGTGHFIFQNQITSINLLLHKYVTWPNSEKKRTISHEFEKKCGFSGVIGCIDGCHIPIKQPPGNATDYYNRKSFQSIVLQGICDNRCVFTDIYIGSPGRNHDARIFRDSPLYEKIVNEVDPILSPEEHLIGDCAYPLLLNVMTPYRDDGHLTEQQTNFNMKLSSARVYIERSFGILKNKFRKLKYLEISDLEWGNKIIAACCILHNFIRIDNYLYDDIIFPHESDEIPQIPHFVNTKSTTAAKNKRDYICLTF